MFESQRELPDQIIGVLNTTVEAESTPRRDLHAFQHMLKTVATNTTYSMCCIANQKDTSTAALISSRNFGIHIPVAHAE